MLAAQQRPLCEISNSNFMTKLNFSKNNPAKDIFELVDFLENDTPSKYFFRGQTKDYSVLIPSIYRNLATSKNVGKGLISLDTRTYKKNLTERDNIKIKELSRLIRDFGRGLGNIIAQQYGITSECIDITCNPSIAAFFATRKYPQYKHYSGASNNPIGVLYRFPAIHFESNLVGLDMILDWIGKKDDVLNKPVWFFKYVTRHNLTNKELAKILSERDHEEDVLFTHPSVVIYSKLYNYMKEHFNEKGFNSLTSIDDTRMSRQQGGFLRPSYVWKCTRPATLEIEFLDRLGQNMYRPGYAIANELVAVEDQLLYPGVEKFFFKHTDKEITKYTPEYLWPDVKTDKMFQLVHNAVYMNNKGYFDRLKLSVLDPNSGIVDRGYY